MQRHMCVPVNLSDDLKPVNIGGVMGLSRLYKIALSDKRDTDGSNSDGYCAYGRFMIKYFDIICWILPLFTKQHLNESW